MSDFSELVDVATEGADPFNTYAQEAAAAFAETVAAWADVGGSSISNYEDAGAEYVKEFGSKAAPVKDGEGNTKGLLSSFKKLFSWDDGDTKANAAKVSVIGGAISGLGAGYFNNERLKKETELMERKIGLEENRDALKAANQNFGGMKFKPPEKGLLFNPAPYQKRKPA